MALEGDLLFETVEASGSSRKIFVAPVAAGEGFFTDLVFSSDETVFGCKLLDLFLFAPADLAVEPKPEELEAANMKKSEKQFRWCLSLH